MSHVYKTRSFLTFPVPDMSVAGLERIVRVVIFERQKR